MTNDELRQMARDSGAEFWEGTIHFMPDELERFAALVSEAERNECAARLRSMKKWDGKPFACTDTVWIEPGGMNK